MASVNDIRSHFLEYFKRHDHEVVASSPLVPHNDPTLMFTNAGMVQFKNVFTGAKNRNYRRAATSQKCVRAGGKHNDLDNVGYTARHHTFFEMLGNFSFGDYFKERAIELAWTLVTKEFGLDPAKLLVTVYAEDDDAFNLWRKVAGLPERKIIRIATNDNFWAMGDTGPCGPCSEIFYDHGAGIPGGPPGSPDADGDRFIEIWNLVFMQFEQVTKESRVNLPKPSIDTGMGLERIAAVMQGEHDNYDIDLFQRLIQASVELTRQKSDGSFRASHRVIADHLRASSFLIADGVTPSNEGRGYVLRRIMRRAMRHTQMMGCEEPLMWRLVPVLVAEMGTAYPELQRARPLIEETLKLEETRFRQTLARGLRLLEDATGNLKADQALPGQVAFQLYDTYGFPLDLTQDALRASGRAVDLEGFNAAMERQRAEARKAWVGSGDVATARIWFEVREHAGATEFLGYEAEAAEGVVLALVKNGTQSQQAGQGESVAIVVNQTPFYAESGGQVGDTGKIITAGGARVRVDDTRKEAGDLFVHYGTVESGTLKVGEAVALQVDAIRRAEIRANHSATHLLHEALRRTLGAHVTQKGSLVAHDRLRFDFSHPKPLSRVELETIEADVNAMTRANAERTTRLMSPEDAVKQGAMALFGEKYGEEVRVVAMGEAGGKAYSVELCGGTHVHRTGDIGLFKVVSEGAVAAGVRRIEAMTGEGARRYLNEREAALIEVADAMKATPLGAAARVVALLEERKSLEREISELRRKLATGEGSGAGQIDRMVKGVRFMARKLDGVPAKELRTMVDDLKKREGAGVFVVLTSFEGKAAVAVGVSDDLIIKGLSAVSLVQAGAKAMGGQGGGGRPDMAQAGGPDPAKADDAIQAIEEAIEQAM
ncbi:MAG: alanine--tRNA ligase [Alphaproteobacteria bacterium]|nr:alanine--tRNA ligase [Alphaproteobacteria bacterium]